MVKLNIWDRYWQLNSCSEFKSTWSPCYRFCSEHFASSRDIQKPKDELTRILSSGLIFVTRLSYVVCHFLNVFLFFFSNSYNGGWRQNWVHSARRPITGLLYLPRVIVRMGNLVEWRLAEESEVFGETSSSVNLSTTYPTWPEPGANPGRRGGKPAINRLSYGAALLCLPYSYNRKMDWMHLKRKC
jgi:hypothetical protein